MGICISHLSFLSKILEKDVLRQLLDHLLTNNLFYSHQSAYCVGHSTETSLLKIVNDLLSALDEDKVSLLSLLDPSAAFDTSIIHLFMNRIFSTRFCVCACSFLRFFPNCFFIILILLLTQASFFLSAIMTQLKKKNNYSNKTVGYGIGRNENG